MPLRSVGIFFIDHDHTSRYARAVKQVSRQTYDALDITFADQVLADLTLGAAAKQYAVRQDNSAFTLAL